jgi:predicted amidohydrolase
VKVALAQITGEPFAVEQNRDLAWADLYNSAIAVGPEGLVLHYRKAHLFAGEKLAFRPGDLGLPVAPTRLGTIGLCVRCRAPRRSSRSARSTSVQRSAHRSGTS